MRAEQKGLRGEKMQAGVIGNAIHVAKVATDEIEESCVACLEA